MFFTEMWERFSYYGMRALLILFLVAKLDDGGWEWSRAEAMSLFGWYVMLVYFLPLLGGWIADNKWGHVKTIIVGAAIITLGHASMAVADLPVGMDLKFMFYVGLLLIVLGTGLFKPNMSATVGKLEEPTLFWLDGHYSGGVTARGSKETPILDEVDKILSTKESRHVLIVDDARCFGTDPYVLPGA